jgi:hypothetical protein
MKKDQKQRDSAKGGVDSNNNNSRPPNRRPSQGGGDEIPRNSTRSSANRRGSDSGGLNGSNHSTRKNKPPSPSQVMPSSSNHNRMAPSFEAPPEKPLRSVYVAQTDEVSVVTIPTTTAPSGNSHPQPRAPSPMSITCSIGEIGGHAGHSTGAGGGGQGRDGVPSPIPSIGGDFFRGGPPPPQGSGGGPTPPPPKPPSAMPPIHNRGLRVPTPRPAPVPENSALPPSSLHVPIPRAQQFHNDGGGMLHHRDVPSPIPSLEDLNKYPRSST